MVDFRNAVQNAAQQALCNALSDASQFAAWFTGAVLGEDAPNPARMANNVVRMACNREPPIPPAQQPTPGQGNGIEYRWTSSWTAYEKISKININGSSSGACGTSASIFGPVSGPFRQQVGTQFFYQISGYDSGGAPKTLNVTAGYPIDVYLIKGLNFQLFRCGGGPDNFGPLRYPPPLDPEFRTQPITITYQDNSSTTINIDSIVQIGSPIINADFSVNVPIFITRANVNIQPTLDLNIPLTVNGPNFSFGGSSSQPPGSTTTPTSGPTPAPSPSPPASQDDVNDVGDQVQDVKDELDAIKEELENLKNKLGTPGIIYRAAPGDPCPPIVYEPTSLADALTVGINSLTFLERLQCPGESVPESLIDEGVSSQENQVTYIVVGNSVKSVRLQLLTPLPPKIAYTMSNELGGFFGGISTAYATATDTVQQIYTLNTFHRVDKYPSPRRIRLYLKPGIQWRLFDTGER